DLRTRTIRSPYSSSDLCFFSFHYTLQLKPASIKTGFTTSYWLTSTYPLSLSLSLSLSLYLSNFKLIYTLCLFILTVPKSTVSNWELASVIAIFCIFFEHLDTKPSSLIAHTQQRLPVYLQDTGPQQPSYTTPSRPSTTTRSGISTQPCTSSSRPTSQTCSRSGLLSGTPT
ncbi:hypothetical protein GE09DRAFT_1189426, partial [Coniochaeta sp. 2T2.1]